MNSRRLNVVLLEPEIPQNTGSIGRLCLAAGAKLHLVEPLGFQIDASRLRRAGLDYWEHLDVQVHPSTEAFLASVPSDAQMVFVEADAGRTVYEHQFEPGAYLVFGKETFGIPDWILNRYAAQTIRIPMFDARVRSINLANATSIVLYEAIRQLSFPGS